MKYIKNELMQGVFQIIIGVIVRFMAIPKFTSTETPIVRMHRVSHILARTVDRIEAVVTPEKFVPVGMVLADAILEWVWGWFGSGISMIAVMWGRRYIGYGYVVTVEGGLPRSHSPP